MKILIVEDDYTSRFLLHEFLKDYGLPHIAVNGQEAVKIFREALEMNKPYDLICMDIMMPEKDGQQALKEIRAIEEENFIFSTDGAKIIMTTAADDIRNKMDAFANLCDGYLVKPIHKEQLLEQLRNLKLIE